MLTTIQNKTKNTITFHAVVCVHQARSFTDRLHRAHRSIDAAITTILNLSQEKSLSFNLLRLRISIVIT
jgi:hypothetical protein